MSLKTVIYNLKKRNKLIKIADSIEGGWAVVVEYEKVPIESDSNDCKRIRQAETRALKEKNTEKSKPGAFKPLSSLWNPWLGQQFLNVDFKHDYSPTSSSGRQYPFQYRSSSYPQHLNSSQFLENLAWNWNSRLLFQVWWTRALELDISKKKRVIPHKMK